MLGVCLFGSVRLGKHWETLELGQRGCVRVMGHNKIDFTSQKKILRDRIILKSVTNLKSESYLDHYNLTPLLATSGNVDREAI